MCKFLFPLLLVTHLLVLQAMAVAHDSESPLPGIKPLEPDETKRASNVDEPVVVGSMESTSQGEGEGEGEGELSTAVAPDIRRLGKHHSTDKSVAGGGVILGGLVTATFAAVFCYIRVTRKRDSGGY